jgi:hypothetical protein
MGDSTSLIAGLIFGSIGVGYCIYGRKQNNFVAFLAGLFLMGLPYVIDNNFVLIGTSIVIMAAPKFIKL